MLNKEAQQKSYAVRMHRLFVQNEEGAEVLNGWVENILQAPLPVDSTAFAQGIAEGQRTFIRHILQMIANEEG